MKVRRAGLRDLYVDSGRAAIMVDEQVIVLSELATSILGAVPEHGHADLSHIVAHVVAAHGAPEPPLDAETSTRKCVLDLAAHHVVEVIKPDSERVPTAVRGSYQADVLAALHGAMRVALEPEGSAKWELPTAVAEQDFLAIVQRHRVGSQLATRLERLALPESLEAGLRAHQARLTAANEAAVRDIHQVLDVLTDADVRVLVFKGMALAVQAWGDPHARGYGDLDLLVAPADLACAHKALTDAGWHSNSAYPTPGASWGWQQFVRTEYEVPLSRGPTDVDLHWHALPARGAFPAFEDLWLRRAAIVIDGRSIATFGQYHALAHSASHSAKDHWRWLRGIADVHRLMSDSETWLLADRPLKADQRLTVGIAGQLFGVPDSSPEVVRRASNVSARTLDHLTVGQLRQERHVARRWVPLRDTVHSLIPLWHAKVRPREYLRRLSLVLMPPSALAQQESTRAYVAIPRALALGFAEFGRRRLSRRTRADRSSSAASGVTAPDSSARKW